MHLSTGAAQQWCNEAVSWDQAERIRHPSCRTTVQVPLSLPAHPGPPSPGCSWGCPCAPAKAGAGQRRRAAQSQAAESAVPTASWGCSHHCASPRRRGKRMQQQELLHSSQAVPRTTMAHTLSTTIELLGKAVGQSARSRPARTRAMQEQLSCDASWHSFCHSLALAGNAAAVP